ncbi:hypothetical protein AQS8620_02147 [Aquimixticola soesokkakensis]|uniref:SGNH hydrolase-type esterase domain-containing protein n=1 Tax=Aquimixticola soesokkakensis TaxID=1519096 RepID=A0A1Y5T1M5_9RHOB|nr:GDSL-type esterase/lipase family protein [Aquimixticola soesokkakensis]SLN50058.1 hypothetical protein AQS8620_02147 [Aquimixticola soesokkakensis]
MPRLLTFGDSNTFGTPPADVYAEGQRLPEGARWPQVCAQALGQAGVAWDLVEQGLPGRTTGLPDPLMGPHMDGRIGLFIALESCGPIDAVTLMLGTNDFKTQFDSPAQDIAARMAFLIEVCLSEEMQNRHGGFECFLICPPAVTDNPEFSGAGEKSRLLARLYASLAEQYDIPFLDAGMHITVSDIDGVHFDGAAHATLGKAVAAHILDEIEQPS